MKLTCRQCVKAKRRFRFTCTGFRPIILDSNTPSDLDIAARYFARKISHLILGRRGNVRYVEQMSICPSESIAEYEICIGLDSCHSDVYKRMFMFVCWERI